MEHKNKIEKTEAAIVKSTWQLLKYPSNTVSVASAVAAGTGVSVDGGEAGGVVVEVSAGDPAVDWLVACWVFCWDDWDWSPDWDWPPDWVWAVFEGVVPLATVPPVVGVAGASTLAAIAASTMMVKILRAQYMQVDMRRVQVAILLHLLVVDK